MLDAILLSYSLNTNARTLICDKYTVLPKNDVLWKHALLCTYYIIKLTRNYKIESADR